MSHSDPGITYYSCFCFLYAVISLCAEARCSLLSSYSDLTVEHFLCVLFCRAQLTTMKGRVLTLRLKWSLCMILTFASSSITMASHFLLPHASILHLILGMLLWTSLTWFLKMLENTQSRL